MDKQEGAFEQVKLYRFYHSDRNNIVQCAECKRLTSMHLRSSGTTLYVPLCRDHIRESIADKHIRKFVEDVQ